MSSSKFTLQDIYNQLLTAKGRGLESDFRYNSSKLTSIAGSYCNNLILQ